MKLNKIIQPIIVSFFFFVFIFAKSPSSYQTQCVSLTTDGFISIKIWDTKKGKNYKPEEARKNSIHAILYSGIAGENGCVTQKPLLNTEDEKKKFEAIQKEFFSKNGKWVQFTTNSATETTPPEIIGEKDWKVYQVSVSKNELRKFLEEKNIIKSLNSGFK